MTFRPAVSMRRRARASTQNGNEAEPVMGFPQENLWRWNSGPISWDDLRLKLKHPPAAGVHQYLHPLDVIGAVRRVVPEGFEAGKVLESPPTHIEKRSVNSEVMRVTVHIHDRL